MYIWYAYMFADVCICCYMFVYVYVCTWMKACTFAACQIPKSRGGFNQTRDVVPERLDDAQEMIDGWTTGEPYLPENTARVSISKGNLIGIDVKCLESSPKRWLNVTHATWNSY